jgi:biopolymer transport protein ExbD|tara:strand:- start:1564 stop:1779 length:216 start_codon:yes stop_codon:yes gene_type:complete
MNYVTIKNKTHTIVTKPQRSVNTQTRVQELKQSTSSKANPQVTTPIQRRVITSKIYKITKQLNTNELEDKT